MIQSVLEYNLSCFSFEFVLLIFGQGKWEGRQSVSSTKFVQSGCVQLRIPRNHTSGVANLQSSVMKSQVRKTINSSS